MLIRVELSFPIFITTSLPVRNPLPFIPFRRSSFLYFLPTILHFPRRLSSSSHFSRLLATSFLFHLSSSSTAILVSPSFLGRPLHPLSTMRVYLTLLHRDFIVPWENGSGTRKQRNRTKNNGGCKFGRGMIVKRELITYAGRAACLSGF